MAKKKTLLHVPAVQIVIATLVGWYMYLIRATVRWEIQGKDNVQFHWDDPKGAVLCFWHGRFMGAISTWPIPLQPVSVLVSKSVDGDIITRTAHMVGVGAIRGSTWNKRKKQDKGGAEAYAKMLAYVREGGCIGVTPDGPRGPRYRAAAGAGRLAVQSGSYLLTMGWSTRWRIVFNTWDKIILPLPFSRGVIVWGTPVLTDTVEADAEGYEAVRKAVERSLNDANRQADLACGVTPIEPAPAEADEAGA